MSKILLSSNPSFIGCDVSKDTVSIYSIETKIMTEVANDIDALTSALSEQGPIKLVVCEATGGYESKL